MLPNFPKPLPETDLPANRTVCVDDRLYEYLFRHSVRESDLLFSLRRETQQYHMARMQVSPEVGQLLAFLIQLSGAKRVLEVGVFTGYSTLSMAQALPADGYLLALEKKAMWLEIANRYLAQAQLSAKVETRLGDARTAMQELVSSGAEGFDFMFVDADKKNLIAYYELGKQLLCSGGCMAIDNTLWWGNVADPSFTDKDTCIVRELNDRVLADRDVSLSQIPIGDGLTLIRKH